MKDFLISLWEFILEEFPVLLFLGLLISALAFLISILVKSQDAREYNKEQYVGYRIVVQNDTLTVINADCCSVFLSNNTKIHIDQVEKFTLIKSANE